jgi:hypothetical protein
MNNLMQGPISNPEYFICNGHKLECAPESDFKIWTRDSITELDSIIQFRGWQCIVYSLTYHFQLHSKELLLRREMRII